MGDRRQERRAQMVGLSNSPHPLDVLHEMDTLDRQRTLVAQRIQEAALLGPQEGAWFIAANAEDADLPTARAHRKKQPLGSWERLGIPAGRAVLLPCPFGGGEIGFIQRVLRRIAGFDRDRSVV